MPKIAIHEHEEGVCYIPFEDPVPKRTIGLFWRKTSARKELLELLVKLMRR
jgi:LysR family transcriptional regulator, hydrogen peroxide-inducible genes activator